MLEEFLAHLNSLRPTITFTRELEEDGKLPFLDTLLHQQNDGSIDIIVYRKPTHTDRYLQFSSHHPHQVKLGIASCLFYRARTIAQGNNIVTEEEHLRRVLAGNGYPETLIKRASKPHTRVETTDEPLAMAYIPYVAGLSEDVRRICQR